MSSTYSHSSSSPLSSPLSQHGVLPPQQWQGSQVIAKMNQFPGSCGSESMEQTQLRSILLANSSPCDSTSVQTALLCCQIILLVDWGNLVTLPSLSCFLETYVMFMDAILMLQKVLNHLQSCWNSVAQPWDISFHPRDTTGPGIAIRWMRLEVLFFSDGAMQRDSVTVAKMNCKCWQQMTV